MSLNLIDQALREQRIGSVLSNPLESAKQIESLQSQLANMTRQRDELKKQNRQLKEALIGWRQRTWPGTDQRKVIERDFPEVKEEA